MFMFLEACSLKLGWLENATGGEVWTANGELVVGVQPLVVEQVFI